ICGGLGPTHDDRTMEAVAAALGVPLEPCAPIAARIAQIADRVRDAAFEGDPLGMQGLQKMALAPAGAQALECASGVIPAVTVQAGDARLVVLPGPPRELEAVFRECVEPSFLDGTGAVLHREEIEHPFPESALAAALAAAESAHPAVKIGSYPLAESVLVRIAGPAAEVAGAAAVVRAAIDALHSSEDGRRLLDYMRTRSRN
ncbi:MAG: molybdopterin-binding protein, partial [Actinomycetota bacterium]